LYPEAGKHYRHKEKAINHEGEFQTNFGHFEDLSLFNRCAG
jgi:hypothetical protein